MKPEHRFHSYVTAATVTVMYFSIQHVVPFLNLRPKVALFVEPIGAVLISVGVYKLLATLLLATSRKWKFVKRHLLGPAYLNGTWVGKFQPEDSSTVYTVEHFEQTLSSLRIRGEARTADGRPYASWYSTSENVDEKSGILTYTYNCEKNDDKVSFQGVCVFQFDRTDETSPPTKIRGYSADLVDGKRTENREMKDSENLVAMDEMFDKIANGSIPALKRAGEQEHRALADPGQPVSIQLPAKGLELREARPPAHEGRISP